jgi:hypothetical protein
MRRFEFIAGLAVRRVQKIGVLDGPCQSCTGLTHGGTTR